MSPGRQEAGSSTSTTVQRRRGSPRPPPSRPPRSAGALRRPRPDGLLQQPQAHDVAQVADRAVDAALVGEVGPRGWPRVSTGRVELEPDEGPRPAGDVGEAVPSTPARRRPPTPCRGSPTATTGHGAASPMAPSTSGRTARACSPGSRSGGRSVGVDAEPLAPGRSPSVRVGRVEQTGGRGVGDLGHRRRRPVSQYASRSGQQQHGPAAHRLRAARLGDELEDGVERQDLEPGARVELAGGDGAARARRHAVGAPVAVVHRVAEQRAVRVEQAVVDRPGVDADAVQVPAASRAAAAARRGPRGTGRARPSAASPPTAARAAVGEPVDLVQLERALRDRRHHDPTAGGAEVDRGDGLVVMPGASCPAPASAQERRGDAGVDRDVQAGGLGEVPSGEREHGVGARARAAPRA